MRRSPSVIGPAVPKVRTPHAWEPVAERHPEFLYERVRCKRCGLEIWGPNDWRAEDWKDSGFSPDCDEQLVMEVLAP